MDRTMKEINSRSALMKVASDNVAFEKFTQEIGVVFIRTFAFGLITGFALGGITIWLIVS